MKFEYFFLTQNERGNANRTLGLRIGGTRRLISIGWDLVATGVIREAALRAELPADAVLAVLVRGGAGR